MTAHFQYMMYILVEVASFLITRRKSPHAHTCSTSFLVMEFSSRERVCEIVRTDLKNSHQPKQGTIDLLQYYKMKTHKLEQGIVKMP
jgi:hypothetical protein